MPFEKSGEDPDRVARLFHLFWLLLSFLWYAIFITAGLGGLEADTFFPARVTSLAFILFLAAPVLKHWRERRLKAAFSLLALVFNVHVHWRGFNQEFIAASGWGAAAPWFLACGR